MFTLHMEERSSSSSADLQLAPMIMLGSASNYLTFDSTAGEIKSGDTVVIHQSPIIIL